MELSKKGPIIRPIRDAFGVPTNPLNSLTGIISPLSHFIWPQHKVIAPMAGEAETAVVILFPWASLEDYTAAYVERLARLGAFYRDTGSSPGMLIADMAAAEKETGWVLWATYASTSFNLFHDVQRISRQYVESLLATESVRRDFVSKRATWAPEGTAAEFLQRKFPHLIIYDDISPHEPSDEPPSEELGELYTGSTTSEETPSESDMHTSTTSTSCHTTTTTKTTVVPSTFGTLPELPVSAYEAASEAYEAASDNYNELSRISRGAGMCVEEIVDRPAESLNFQSAPVTLLKWRPSGVNPLESYPLYYTKDAVAGRAASDWKPPKDPMRVG